jgi:hypothetical protein
MLARISKENQHLYINNTGIVGIQNFNANYASPIEIVKSLGMESVTYHNNSNVTAEITINKLLIDNDPFINFIDYDSTFSGHVDYKSRYFAFNSGILTNYRLGCSIGEIPQLSVTINTLGEFGSGVAKPSTTSLQQPNIDITDYSNIEIDLDDFQFNRLQSFNLNISSNKNIIYAIGNSYPVDIKIIPPIVVELEFGIKPDDYNLKNIRDLLCKYKVDSFSIKFNKFKDPSQELFRFTFNEALFMGETFGGSADTSSDVIIKYHAFLYDQRNIPLSSPLNIGDANLYVPSPEGGVVISNDLSVGDTNLYVPNPEGSITLSSVIPIDPRD